MFFGVIYAIIGVFALSFGSGYAANGINYAKKSFIKSVTGASQQDWRVTHRYLKK
jgi:hypothetical protein